MPYVKYSPQLASNGAFKSNWALFVYTGSPMAEAAFRDTVNKAGYEDRFEVIDSCGTAGYHHGDDPDPSMFACFLGIRLGSTVFGYEDGILMSLGFHIGTIATLRDNSISTVWAFLEFVVEEL